MNEPVPFAAALQELEQGQPAPGSVERVFSAILGGAWTPAQIAGYIVALRIRGESARSIAEAARALRGAMLPVQHAHDIVLDTCGTGGDGQATLNISTGAAIIAAAHARDHHRFVVAKHGNRAVSSRSGSADVLEALGIDLGGGDLHATELLDRIGIAFLMAPNHHPAMRFAAPVRRELGVRTVFNSLGPLANPAAATHQLLGAFSDDLLPILAETLMDLGSRRAWVVRSQDGLDELSPFGPTRVLQLDQGKLSESSVRPEDFGLSISPPGAIAGGDAAFNAGVLRRVIGGEAHPSRAAFLLNAAGALVVAEGLEPREATKAATAAVDSGAARRLLEEWQALSKAGGR
ncbi:MAG: anthranilate phosphoribosyltransferase, partial [Polyangiaceae bacterium]